MDELESWRLCDELTVVQAALLISGLNPADFPYVMTWEEHKKPEKFSAAFASLCHAILGNRLPATLRIPHEPVWDDSIDNYVSCEVGDPNWEKTTVFVEDLQNWLRSRGIKTGFFFPQPSDTTASPLPGYLNPTHSHYASKLAAAIAAWHAVDANPELTKGKTVKQAMKKWLEKNATQFKLLVKDDGTLNAEGIEETAKIANWDDKCGAPKTPEKRQTEQN